MKKRIKNRTRSILAVGMTAACIAAAGAAPVYAQNTVNDTWVYSDAATTNLAQKTKGTISVTHLNDPGRPSGGTTTPPTVTAYQIVKGTYANGKFARYVKDTSITTEIADLSAPTSVEVTAIAAEIRADTTSLQGIRMNRSLIEGTSDYQYTAEVEAGLYLVLASGADTSVYNPAIVAVNITSEVLPTGENATVGENGSVNMTEYFNNPQNAYLKTSTSGFNKDIVGGSTPLGEGTNTEGDTVKFGDTVSFKLDSMTIPEYTNAYDSVVYKIEDNLAPGSFESIVDLTVKVGEVNNVPASVPAEGENPAVTNYTLTYTKNGETTVDEVAVTAANADAFKIEFTDAYIRAHANQAVEITYSSVFKDTAGLNYAENKNTAKLTYSNDPTDSSSTKTLTDSTYHYTFGIDADIDAQDADHNFETYELNKVTEALKPNETITNYTDVAAAQDAPATKKSSKALAGATFGLYSNSDCAEAHRVGTAVSDSNGHISFRGLDVGTYYLKETSAPDHYSLNEYIFKIVISATLNADGVMTSYSINTYYKAEGDNDYTTQIGAATYTNTPAINESTDAVTNTIVIANQDGVDPAEVINSALAVLPSTGGVGTIVLTVFAAIGMAGFLVLFIISRRRKREDVK